MDFAGEVGGDANTLGPCRFEKNWAQVLITESCHGFPRCPPRLASPRRTLRHPTASHPAASPLPAGPSTRSPGADPGDGREGGLVSELRRSRGEAQGGSPAGSRVPDSGTCARVRSAESGSCGHPSPVAPPTSGPSPSSADIRQVREKEKPAPRLPPLQPSPTVPGPAGSCVAFIFLFLNGCPSRGLPGYTHGLLCDWSLLPPRRRQCKSAW